MKLCETQLIAEEDYKFARTHTFEHDDSKELPVMAMWKIWNCQTLHKSLEITNAIHVTSQTLYTRRSLMQSMSHLFLARCMYVCTLRMLMENTVQLVQQVHIHRCLIVHNAITIVNSAKVCVLANL